MPKNRSSAYSPTPPNIDRSRRPGSAASWSSTYSRKPLLTRMDFSLPRAGCLAGAFFVIRPQYATGDSRALEVLQHPAPMRYLSRAEDARERRGNQLHALGAIDPGAVTLETEN